MDREEFREHVFVGDLLQVRVNVEYDEAPFLIFDALHPQQNIVVVEKDLGLENPLIGLTQLDLFHHLHVLLGKLVHVVLADQLGQNHRFQDETLNILLVAVQLLGHHDHVNLGLLLDFF